MADNCHLEKSKNGLSRQRFDRLPPNLISWPTLTLWTVLAV